MTHTHQVLEMLDAVLTNMLDIETGARGYVLTGEASYLEPYNNTIDHVRQNVKDVRELTADNPVQQSALDGLEAMISKGLEAVRHPIEIRTREGLAAGVESVRTGTGKQSMDQIRNQLAEMKQEENRLLKSRTEDGGEKFTDL